MSSMETLYKYVSLVDKNEGHEKERIESVSKQKR